MNDRAYNAGVEDCGLTGAFVLAQLCSPGAPRSSTSQRLSLRGCSFEVGMMESKWARHNETNRAWKRAHKDQIREYRRRYREEHPELVKVQQRAAFCRWRRNLRQRALVATGASCAICGTSQSLHIHHVGGGGTDHRKHGGNKAVYRDAVRCAGDGTYQTLCRKCHLAAHSQNSRLKQTRTESYEHGAGI